MTIAFAQSGVNVTPTVTPTVFSSSDPITVTYNVTGTTLANLTDAFIWVWIPNKSLDAKYNINPANETAAPAKFVKSVVSGQTKFIITFSPQDFFNDDISNEEKIGMLIKGNDWSNGKSVDYVTDLGFQITINAPANLPVFVNNNEELAIAAQTRLDANWELYINDVLVDTDNTTTSYTYTHTVTETSGYGTIRMVASSGDYSTEKTFQYILSVPSHEVERPDGIIPGINYDEADHTRVTLCLLAPGKSSVYVRGDFSNWDVLPENIMNKDGEYFWIELTGLTEGVEYGYQYFVNETLILADPFADKVLDTDDQYIPASVYPDLKPFPAKARSGDWYENRVAVFQTGQTPYEWQTINYQKPATTDLVIYELLIRDFFGSSDRSYQNLIDTIGYFKNLGVNAIQLMPIMEFNGNDSWGYNPTFLFAPDKYYGPKNKLKEFIDKCHENGIAVILDIAMNHHDMPNPYVLMDFDFANTRPLASNKWFNPTAKHPFNVFFDMNHESLYTKDYLDTVNYYWLNEYKIDGFRFDLSKGFTQTNNPNNVGAWSAKDDSRIAILKRMSDAVRQHTPDAILILEHLAENSEETILADYGFLMWGNMNWAYNQNTKGESSGSDISGTSYKQRAWADPHLVAYMESHDEERLMYRNTTDGKSFDGYNVKDLSTGIDRVKAAVTIFFSIPGPKMVWQFGELGYDISIDYNGRVGAKPVKWDYYSDPTRNALFEHFSEMIDLKTSLKVFETTDFTVTTSSDLIKQVTLKNSPYVEAPASEDEMNIQAVANFDILRRSVDVSFPHEGWWFDHFSDDFVFVDEIPFSMSLAPGEYKLFKDYSTTTITSVEERNHESFQLFPNPIENQFIVSATNGVVNEVKMISVHGYSYTPCLLEDGMWSAQSIPSGVYLLEVTTGKGKTYKKVLKK